MDKQVMYNIHKLIKIRKECYKPRKESREIETLRETKKGTILLNDQE